MSDNEKAAPVVATRPRAPSDESTSTQSSLKATSLKSPRAARFAEATAVNSPIEPKKPPFHHPQTNHYMAQPQPSDVGFGYLHQGHESVEMPDTDNNDYPAMPKTPKSPLKSALRTPGAPPKGLNALRSPTFREEEVLEKREKHTDRRQAHDLKIKTRVRMAKMLMRGVNFSCSLIVLAMLASTFSIFNATKVIPPRNNLPPWAENQKIWPQVTLLVIACVSLFMSVVVFYAYYKGGHKKAEKVGLYYTMFAVGFFIFSIIMWGIGAGILQSAKNHSNNKDMWGWSCVNNQRKQLFQNNVNYDLLCRLQNWSLLCAIIEIVVETITIAIYGIIFYRFWSKNKLRKSMAQRDRARSDLYIAQLRAQSAPNTPGLLSPGLLRPGGHQPPIEYYAGAPDIEAGHHEAGRVQYIDPSPQPSSPAKPFKLQAPPIRIQGATPRMEQEGFVPVATVVREATPTPPAEAAEERRPMMGEMPRELLNAHFAAAPGEQVYDEVPIPGAYQAQLSPGMPPHHMQYGFPQPG